MGKKLTLKTLSDTLKPTLFVKLSDPGDFAGFFAYTGVAHKTLGSNRIR